MALQAKIIKQKLRAIGNIKKITKTMEMVSVSKMRRTVSRVGFSREYARLLLELLVNLSKTQHLTHPLLSEKKEGAILCIVITSNKGLCGSYNSRIERSVKDFYEKEKNIAILPIGRVAGKIAQKLSVPFVTVPTRFSESMDPDTAHEFVENLTQVYREGDYKEIKIFYTQFVRQLEYVPCERTIIPLSPKIARDIIEEIKKGSSGERFEKNSLAEYEFEPDPKTILDTVIPMLLGALFFQIALESFASEHSSRMIAMKNATDNAESLLEDLSLSYNRVRQAGITQEMSEIIGGANALSV